MNLLLLLYLFNHEVSNCDTLLMPLKGGKLLDDSVYDVYRHRIAESFVPSADYQVRSCSDGFVKKITIIKPGTVIEIHSSNGLRYFYLFHGKVSTHEGERIAKGKILGCLAKNGTPTYLTFSVFKGFEALDARKFVINSE